MRLAFLGLALVLTACSSREVPVEPDPATRLTTPQGNIVGYVEDSGAHVWRAIPYARPPVGDMRWQPALAHSGWDGEREAITAPTPCPQLGNGLNADMLGIEVGEVAGSEDCLYLDVYAPPNARDLPVMVWIHGGSNTWGYADQYNGSQLAMDQNVVVVVVQYRLGPIGFFSHPVLRESGSGVANFALTDHLAALNWVQDNIASYGGDAGTVTIFGESAGGTNVAALMASPLASGLFHRAIMQSGSASSVQQDEAENGGGFTVHPFNEAAQAITGAEVSAEALRQASLVDIYAAFTGADGRLEVPTVIADGVSIPAGGVMSAFDSLETFNAVPLITGTNRDETKLYNGLNEDFVARPLGILFRIRDENLYNAVADYQGRIWAISGVDEVADAITAAGNDDVWTYRFDWDEGGANFFLDSSRVFGAMHSMEIPFVFNHFNFFGPRLDPIAFDSSNEAGRLALAHEMGSYWARFARQGDPGASWTRWSDGPARMRFDSPEAGGSQMMPGRFTLPDLAADIMSDPHLPEERRCELVEAMQGPYFDDANALGPLTDC
ncbi:carboxylesterase family protein [Hyphobacterium sp. HN65]|uniref:Carboxylesterase family protein n=1 Tax=Hyphobacterium lacteum TaxID=3116575 RepID=A0ABU7LPF6_9PROT|nr:carboxylesterase family protein [Hyphobacterium sp. HN65]MEE2525780.1 carboxylesterase family protein [Hyphobacterium sp. HN65]